MSSGQHATHGGDPLGSLGSSRLWLKKPVPKWVALASGNMDQHPRNPSCLVLSPPSTLHYQKFQMIQVGTRNCQKFSGEITNLQIDATGVNRHPFGPGAKANMLRLGLIWGLTPHLPNIYLRFTLCWGVILGMVQALVLKLFQLYRETVAVPRDTTFGQYQGTDK